MTWRVYDFVMTVHKFHGMGEGSKNMKKCHVIYGRPILIIECNVTRCYFKSPNNLHVIVITLQCFSRYGKDRLKNLSVSVIMYKMVYLIQATKLTDAVNKRCKANI